MTLETAKQQVQLLHDGSGPPQRWGMIGHNGHPSFEKDGCFQSAGFVITNVGERKPQYFYAAFHGDGPKLSFPEIVSTEKFNAALMKEEKPYDKFVGTQRTLVWVKYLLDPLSPWKDLLPFLAEKDPEFINNGGFIWHDLLKVPSKLLYNFLMAMRFPWEMPRNFGTWLELCRAGVEGNRALYLSMNFMLDEKATSIEGPWTVIYPWSFLEEAGLEAAKAFITASPNNLRPQASTSPNVAPLWKLPGQKWPETDKWGAELQADKSLQLHTILETLEKCVEQKAGM